MSKQIQRDGEIYLAADILGRYEDGNPTAIDQKTGERLDPRNIDHKIKIYEREVKGWFLDIASSLVNSDSFNSDSLKNGFVVLMICMAYFEGVEQYKTGIVSSSRSKECFKDSIKRIYPGKFEDKEIDKLYAKSRCGLFHNGMVKGGVVFGYGLRESIEFSNNGDIIQINPRKLLEDIKNDFEQYLDELKNDENKTTRENFDRIFSVL